MKNFRNIKTVDKSIPARFYQDDQHLMNCWEEAYEILHLKPIDRVYAISDYGLESDNEIIELDDEIEEIRDEGLFQFQLCIF